MQVDTVAAVRRTHQAWFAYGTRQEPLTHGIAFYSAERSQSPQLNQFREVLLAGDDASAAWREAEGFFEARGLRCGRWVPSSEQSPQNLESFLADHGFRRVDTSALLLTAWPEASTLPEVRLLPVRAVLSQYRRMVAEQTDAVGRLDPSFAQAAEMHVDDPQMDLFVALRGGLAVGFGGLHQVGDIACLRDIYVAPPSRGRGTGRAIVAHVVALARRIAPRVICASAPAGDQAALSLLRACGFEEAGRLPEFHRLTGSP